MSSVEPRYLTQAAIQSITAKLALPAHLTTSQDWDLLASDESRLTEFVDLYVTTDLTADEKFALMSIIVASLEKCLEGKGTVETAWPGIRKILLDDRVIHAAIVTRWALWGLENEVEDAEDGFHVTPLFRALAAELRLPRA